jgi:hypothetical protein
VARDEVSTYAQYVLRGLIIRSFFGGVALFAVVCVQAQPTTGIDIDEPVPIYTNADLEKYAGEELPTSEVEGGMEDLGWDFVQNFIERQYRIINADRSYDLDRRMTDAEIEEIESLSRRQRYGLALPIYNSFWGHGNRVATPYRGGGSGRKQRLTRAVLTASPAELQRATLHRRITPIHARPAPSVRQKVKFSNPTGSRRIRIGPRH